MHQQVSVENLGPIKSIKDLYIKKYNLVIGVSASGKSVLAKIIYFFNYIFLSPYESDFEKSLDLDKDLLQDLLKDFFPEYDNYSIKYTYRKGLYLNFQLTKSKLSISISDSMKALIAETNQNFKEYKKQLRTEKLYVEVEKLLSDNNLSQKQLKKQIEEIKRELPSNYITTIKENFYKDLDIINPIFIPATRSFVSDFDTIRLHRMNAPFRTRDRFYRHTDGDITLRLFSEEYGKIQRNFEEIINGDFEEILKGKVKSLKRRMNKQIVLDIKGKKLPVQHWSSGQKEAVPIAILLQTSLTNNLKNFFIIEEPEAHLFPEDQKKIFDKIIEVVNKTDSKIFITTHSPYLLMSANNLLEAQKKNYEKLEQKFIKEEDLTVQKLKDGINHTLLKDGLINGDYIDSVGDDIFDEFDEIVEYEKK